MRVKTIALPTEHGGWGFLLEPMLLAMLVAPTLAGALYALAAVAAFLARHPLKLLLKRRGTRSRRYTLSAQIATGYVVAAVAAFASAVFLAGWETTVPIFLLGPFVLLFLFFDLRNRARELLPEIAGPLGLAATAPIIALAAGWSWAGAFVLWTVMTARSVPSVVYVRARLRLERSQAITRTTVLFTHLFFAGVITVLVGFDWVPTTALLAFILLALRTWLGLSSYRRFTRAKQIGILELVMGVLYSVIVAAGYWSGF